MSRKRKVFLVFCIAVIGAGVNAGVLYGLDIVLSPVSAGTPSIQATYFRIVGRYVLWLVLVVLSGFFVGKYTASRFCYPSAVGALMGLESVADGIYNLARSYGIARTFKALNPDLISVVPVIGMHALAATIGGIIWFAMRQRLRSDV